MRLSWSQPEDLVPHELVASRDEGRDVDRIADAWRSAGGSIETLRAGASTDRAPDDLRSTAERILDELDALPLPEDAGRPRSFDRILAAAAIDPVRRPAPEDLEDRVHGAWLGRAMGCLLGKPVEKIPAEGIRELLTSPGRWPLRYYFSARGVSPEVLDRWPWNRRSGPTSLVENIDGMPEDDDLNFPMLNLGLLESVGRDFTVDDVAQEWLADLPAGRVFTAERAAYRNLLEGHDPDACARIRNPFREWIGALIRGDVFGWVNPGDPVRAARMAFEDARLTHTGDGLHGELWVAAAASTALVTDDVDEVLDAGESVVPEHSQLTAALRFGRDLGRQGGDLDGDLEALGRRFADMHWVHVLNNAGTIAWALTRGAGRLEESAPLAVMAGWDTDSVGATVGGLCGAMTGRAALPEDWTRPLQNRIATSLPGLHDVAISDLARRTMRLIDEGRAS